MMNAATNDALLNTVVEVDSRRHRGTNQEIITKLGRGLRDQKRLYYPSLANRQNSSNRNQLQ